MNAENVAKWLLKTIRDYENENGTENTDNEKPNGKETGLTKEEEENAIEIESSRGASRRVTRSGRPRRDAELKKCLRVTNSSTKKVRVAAVVSCVSKPQSLNAKVTFNSITGSEPELKVRFQVEIEIQTMSNIKSGPKELNVSLVSTKTLPRPDVDQRRRMVDEGGLSSGATLYGEREGDAENEGESENNSIVINNVFTPPSPPAPNCMSISTRNVSVNNAINAPVSDLSQRTGSASPEVNVNASASNNNTNANVSVSKDHVSLESSVKGGGSHVKDKEPLKIYYCNVRGFNSKKESIQKIANDKDPDIMVLTETNSKGTLHPKINDMITFYRNREVLHMGGLSVLVKNKFQDYVVRSKVGQGHNEMLTVKFSCFQPRLAIIAVYGAQKSVGNTVLETNIRELFFEVQECKAAGFQTVVLGDTNLQLGRENIPGNDMCVSKMGSLFNELMAENGMKVANNLAADPTTFQRKTLNRALDVMLVEELDIVKELEIDHNKAFTPFSVKTSKVAVNKVFTDHKPIMATIEVRRVMPDSKLPPNWNMRKYLGRQKFDILTDEAAEWLIDMCEEVEDVDEVVDRVDKLVKKAKFRAYGKITTTKKKNLKEEEKKVWACRLALVHKMAREFENERAGTRIWKARKIAIGSNDKQRTAVKDYRTGQMLDDLEEISTMLIQYNAETMGKETPTPEVELLRATKNEVLEELLSNVESFPECIPWKVYMQVVEKIMAQKKGVLADFVNSGPGFKCAIYVLLNRIYQEAVRPKKFRRAVLTMLWKRKGSISELTNHRFIHEHHWLGKIYEKCLVAITSPEMVRATPDFQVGGIPNKSTREHLLAAMLIMKNINAKGKAVPILLCDVRKCFDKLWLSDMLFDAAVTGADLRAIKALKGFHEDFEIVMASDANKVNPASAIIPNTAGQGTNGAPGWAGNSQAQTLEKNVNFDLCVKVGPVQTRPKAFVDDVCIIPGSAAKARLMAPQLTKAFDELSIKIHGEKTVLVIPGKTKAAEEMRRDLTESPMIIQGNEIGIVEKDAYLGMIIHQGGVKESIEATLKSRTGKAWGKVAPLKAILGHPQLIHEGWLGAATSIFQGIIPATMLYSGEVWIDINEGTIEQMEKDYKGMLYAILEIHRSTSYATVLAETGLLKIRHILNKARLIYTSQVWWSMGETEVGRLLRYDHEARGAHSHVSNMVRLAEFYRLPNMLEAPLDEEVVGRQVKRVNDEENWEKCWVSNSVESRLRLREKFRPQFNWTKSQARARLLKAANNLKFLSQASGWRTYYRARQMSTRCPSRMCKEEDTERHARTCPFMETKWEAKFTTDKKLQASYLVKLNRERRVKYNLPIL